MSTTCSAASRAAHEPLGGTGIQATRWLCVESRIPWGHDAVEGGGFPPDVTTWLHGRGEKVLAIRRPGRRSQPVVVFAAETTEEGGRLVRLELDRIDDLPDRDPWIDGEELTGLLLLVCTHGRRDACCSRLGLPVFTALDRHHGSELVWQCSHTGGHRFAPNVIALPVGVTLGRVEPTGAVAAASLLSGDRIPLGHYRGRSIYDGAVQAAEVAARQALTLDRVTDLRLEGRDENVVRFDAGGRRLEVLVTDREPVLIPKSCGAEPELVPVYEVEVR